MAGNSEDPTESAMASEKLDDILIAVMGITGSGKSTFISHCTEDVVPIGNQLQSHTQEVTPYLYKFASQSNVHLIDTPGFDDTSRDDTDVLRDIASWLTLVYQRRIDLRGVIYLHRITDTRMQGSALKNLFMFKKLCGPEGLKNVILATTMWENVDTEDGSRREADLRDTPEFWKTMIENHGSRMVRHQNSTDSAVRIIESLLESTELITYAIQNEMVNQGKDLDQTSAGQELWNIQAEERARFEQQLLDLKRDMTEAQKLQDMESQKQIQKLELEKNLAIMRLEAQQRKMHISLAKLHKEERDQLKKMLERLKLESEESKAEQQQLRHTIARLSQKLETYSPARGDSSDSYDSDVDSVISQQDRRHQDSALAIKGSRLTFSNESHTKGFSLALCGQYYFFCGPVSNFYHLSPEWQVQYDQNDGKDWMVCMGPSGSLARIYKNYRGGFEIDFESLKSTHPTLFEYIMEEREREITFISLGSHGWYFMESMNDSHFQLRLNGPSDVKDLNHVSKVWFGYKDTWIAETDHSFYWDLKGYYGDLERILDDDHCRGRDNIVELVLNIENGTDWIILYPGGHYKYEIASKDTGEALRDWLEENHHS